MPKPKVLILGGGFAGTFTAKELQRKLGREIELTLIDSKNYFVFQPLLPEIAGGTVSMLDAVAPLRLLLPGVDIRPSTVTGIDFDHRLVRLSEGAQGDVVELAYDRLLLAFGQVIDLGRFPGLADHAFTLKNAADAFALRNHVIGCLEQAEHATAEHRRRLLTFTVIGGGLSGIEVVGEVEELVRHTRRYYPRLSPEDVRFVVVEFQKRILGELDEGLAAYAEKKLKQRGIEFWLGTGVKSAAQGWLEFSDGRILDTGTVVATIGNGPLPLLRRLPLDLYRGRVRTDRFMRVPGFRGVWAAGDAAAIPLGDDPDAPLVPPTAQAAVREARHLARNMAADLKGEPLEPFSYTSKGTLASLGGRRAVADIHGWHFHGRIAWLMWRIFYLGMLPGIATKVRVATDRLLDFVLPRNIVQTQGPGEASTRFVHHRPGQVVMRDNQLGPGFHLVIAGTYRREDAEGRVSMLHPGDYFGDNDGVDAATGAGGITVSANEPSCCLLIRRQDFDRIARALQSTARHQRPEKLGRAFGVGSETKD